MDSTGVLFALGNRTYDSYTYRKYGHRHNIGKARKLMEIAFVLALVAIVLFAVDFARGLPALNFVSAGLIFFAASIAVYFFEIGIK